MKTITVGLSGINAGDNPGPGIGVARSLKELPGVEVKIVGLAYDAMEPGVYMDWVIDHSCTMPFPSRDGEGFIERLLEIQAQFGLDLVIPSLDSELPVYIRYADKLAAAGIRTFLPSMEQFRLRNKDQLQRIAEEIDLEIPATEVVSSEAALYTALEKLGAPVMVKGLYCGASKAWTTAEAVGHFRTIIADWGYPVIVQSLVTGEELNVVGLGDGEGNSLGQVGMKKLTVTSLGKVWSAVTVKHPAMLAAAERFVSAFNWKGPFELECMVSGDDIWLIELNPRFPAWCWFATGVGVNLPGRLLQTALGLPVEPLPDWESGKLFMRYTYELITNMDRLQKVVTQGSTQS